MRQIRVLHVVSAPMDFFGGLSIFVNKLIEGLRQNNVLSDVLSCYRSNYGDIQEKKDIFTPYYREYRQKTLGKLWGINPISNVLNFLNKNAWKYDILDVHSYIFFSSIQAAFFHRLHKLPPMILHLHGGIQTQSYPARKISQKLFLLFKKLIFDPIFGHFIINTAEEVISVSRKDLAYVNYAFKTKNASNRHWIPNGVDTQLFRPNPEECRQYISYIGRLSEIKGFDVFVKIAQKLHNIDESLQFLVIGQKGELDKLIPELQQTVPLTYLSQVSHEKIGQYYQQTRVFVLPSRTEGLPSTVLEALSCGIPVVASNVGGVSEVVQNGKNGFLFDISNVSDAVGCILKCMEPGLMEKAFTIGPKIINSLFNWEKIAKNTLTIYKKAIK